MEIFKQVILIKDKIESGIGLTQLEVDLLLGLGLEDRR